MTLKDKIHNLTKIQSPFNEPLVTKNQNFYIEHFVTTFSCIFEFIINSPFKKESFTTPLNHYAENLTDINNKMVDMYSNISKKTITKEIIKEVEINNKFIVKFLNSNLKFEEIIIQFWTFRKAIEAHERDELLCQSEVNNDERDRKFVQYTEDRAKIEKIFIQFNFLKAAIQDYIVGVAFLAAVRHGYSINRLKDEKSITLFAQVGVLRSIHYVVTRQLTFSKRSLLEGIIKAELKEGNKTNISNGTKITTDVAEFIYSKAIFCVKNKRQEIKFFRNDSSLFLSNTQQPEPIREYVYIPENELKSYECSLIENHNCDTDDKISEMTTFIYVDFQLLEDFKKKGKNSSLKYFVKGIPIITDNLSNVEYDGLNFTETLFICLSLEKLTCKKVDFGLARFIATSFKELDATASNLSQSVFMTNIASNSVFLSCSLTDSSLTNVSWSECNVGLLDYQCCQEFSGQIKNPTFLISNGTEFIDKSIQNMEDGNSAIHKLTPLFVISVFKKTDSLEKISSYLKKLPNKKWENFEILSCSLNAEDISNICEIFKQFESHSLSIFAFSGNSFDSLHFNELCKTIDEVRVKISVLCMSNNNMNNSNIQSICTNLLGNKNYSIENIDLSGNFFDKNGAKIIARTLGADKKAKAIDISLNPIGDIGLKEFLTGWKFQDLSSLNLSRTKITDAESVNVIVNFMSNASWKELNLSENSLNEAFIKRLMKDLIDNKVKIKKLNLSNVGLTGYFLPFVAEIKLIEKCEIQEVLLANNEKIFTTKQLTASSANALTAMLTNPHLTSATLSASGIKISATLLSSIKETFNFFANLHELRLIDLSNNKISKAELSLIFQGIRDNQKLSELILDNNSIDDQGAQVIKEHLRYHRSMQKLGLAANNIGDKGLCYLIEIFDELTHIDFSGNGISDIGITKAADELEKNKSLRCLNLANNKITNEGIKILNLRLVNNQGLEAINLAGNKFDKDMLESVEKMLELNPNIQHYELVQTRQGYNFEKLYREDYAPPLREYNHEFLYGLLAGYMFLLSEYPVATIAVTVISFPFALVLSPFIVLGLFIADIIAAASFRTIQLLIQQNRNFFKIKHIKNGLKDSSENKKLSTQHSNNNAIENDNSITFDIPTIQNDSQKSISNILEYERTHYFHFMIKFKKDLLEIRHAFNPMRCTEADPDGNTPLHLLAFLKPDNEKDYLQVIKLILTASDVTKVNNQGNSALHIAILNKNWIFVNYILDKKICNIKNKKGEYPLHLIAQYGNKKTFNKALAMTPYNPLLQSSNTADGKNCLHYACLGQNVEIIDLLLVKYNLHSNIPEPSPLNCLCKGQEVNFSALLILLQSGAKVSHIDLDTIATAKSFQKEIFQLMLKYCSESSEIIKFMSMLREYNSKKATEKLGFFSQNSNKLQAKKLNEKTTPSTVIDSVSDRFTESFIAEIYKWFMIGRILQQGLERNNSYDIATIETILDKSFSRKIQAVMLQKLGKSGSMLEKIAAQIVKKVSQIIMNNKIYENMISEIESQLEMIFQEFSPEEIFIGVDKQIETIKNFFDEVKKDPHTKSHFLLLSGPSGTGKTELMKRVSQICGYGYEELERGADSDKYVGAIETRIQNFFKEAKESGRFKCLVIDEIDAICPNYTGTPTLSAHNPDTVVTLIQTEISKLPGTKVVLIGGTNYLTRLKPAIKDRAGITVNFELPNIANRKKIIEQELNEFTFEKKIIDRIAEATSGWSPRLLKLYLEKVGKSANKTIQPYHMEDIYFVEQFEPMRETFRKNYQQEYKGVIFEPPKLKLNSDQDLFSELVALDPKVKTCMEKLDDFLKNSKEYIKRIPEPKFHTIFYGPPGTGKSSLARALANHSDSIFICMESIDPYSFPPDKFRQIFEIAKGFEVAIIYIEEMDKISKQNSPFREILQTEMEGFSKVANTLIVIGSTNYLYDIAKPVLSRFGQLIKVPLPDLQQRILLFKHFIEQLKNTQIDNSLLPLEKECTSLAKVTEGFSPRMIKEVIYATGSDLPFLEKKTGKIMPLTLGDILTKIQEKKEALENAQNNNDVLGFNV